MRERVILLAPPVAAVAAALVVVASVFPAVAADRTTAGTPPADGKSAPGPTAGDANRVGHFALGKAAVIVGPSACPAPDVVWTELLTLVPPERLTQRLAATTGPQPAVQIIDLGIPYRVIAMGRVREYRDEARDCAHRARVAAVFVALTFDPPVGAAADAATRPDTAAVTAPMVVATPEPPRPAYAVRFEIGAGGDAGLGPDGQIAQAGLAFRLAIGRGVWSLVLGTAASFPMDISVNGTRLRHWRLPAELGLRAHFTQETIEPYVEAGLGAGVVSERALDLQVGEEHKAAELGAFATFGLRFAPSNRCAPFVALHAELVPAPPAIETLPRGLVGHTPAVWVGGTAGVSIGVH